MSKLGPALLKLAEAKQERRFCGIAPSLNKEAAIRGYRIYKLLSEEVAPSALSTAVSQRSRLKKHKKSKIEKKAAELSPSPKIQNKLDYHFTTVDPNKWSKFRTSLRSKSVVNAIQQDERADPKLKLYAEMIGRHLQSKGTTQKIGKYDIKFHDDINRHSCSCLDWRYKKSVQGGDCKHIKQLKKEGLTKVAKRMALNSLF